MAQTEYAVRLQHVTKTFGPVVANKDVSLGVRRGEILALLGENGSGKTTLMNMIAGIYYPDEGEIYVGDKAVTIRSPRDALDLGIGMIHQHFKLVDVFTATENIALSMGGGSFDLKKVHEKARAICEKYQFALDLDQKVYEMSVSQKQTLEIVKVLYRGADILILDEPTAVLTPQETEKLFSVIRNMKADGKAVIIITHKLHEVLSISDRVAILRKGEYVGTVNTAETNEQQLTDEQQRYIRTVYRTDLNSATYPLIMTQGSKLDELTDSSIYLSIKMIRRNVATGKPVRDFALIELPTREFDRFIVLPSDGDTTCIIFLDDVVRFCLPFIFAGLGYESFEAYTLKFTRDAEMALDGDIDEGLVEKVARGVRNRKKGEAIRFVYDQRMPEEMLRYLKRKFRIDRYDACVTTI